MGLLKRHAEMAKDQSLLIAAAMQAERRGDTSAAAGYDDQLKELANQMRTVERQVNAERGEEYFVV